MYNLFTVDMESEEEARDKVRQMMAVKYDSPVSISAHGKVVSVDISNPLVSGIARGIGVVFKAVEFCIKDRRCYQKVIRRASF